MPLQREHVGRKSTRSLGADYADQRLMEHWINSKKVIKQSFDNNSPAEPEGEEEIPSALRDDGNLEELERDRRRQLRGAFRLGTMVGKKNVSKSPSPAKVYSSSQRKWKPSPPLRGVTKFQGYISPPTIPRNSRTIPTDDSGKVLLILHRHSGGLSMGIYNGITNRVVKAKIIIPSDGVRMTVEGDARAVIDPVSGEECIHSEVFPGITKIIVTCEYDAIPRPIISLSELSSRMLSDKADKSRKQLVAEHSQVSSFYLPEFEDQVFPEGSLLQTCKVREIPFVDIWFPPQQSSAGASADMWMRSNQICKEVLPGSGSTSPNDLERGPYGDSILLCILATLAETPTSIFQNFVRRLFTTTTGGHLELGSIRLQMQLSGWWRDILIDNYIPVHQPKGHHLWIPSGVRPIVKLNDFWPCYVEKAYAKLLGGYDLISQQHPHMILSDLTGFPSEALRWGSGTTVFSDMAEWHSRGFMLSLITPRLDGEHPSTIEKLEEHYTRQGLLPGHLYHVLQVLQIDNNFMLHIRNPWSRGVEWKGDWGWFSPNWTRRVKDVCGMLDNSTEGTFVCTWAECQNWFSGGVVTYCMENCGEFRTCLTMKPLPSFCIELQIDQPVRLYITVAASNGKGNKI